MQNFRRFPRGGVILDFPERGVNNFRLDQFLFNVSKPHCLWVRGAAGRRGSERNRTTREGGRKILDAARTGGAKFWTSRRKILDFDQFFSMFLKHNFLMFWGKCVAKGGANFGRFPKGGRKFLDLPRRGRKILDLINFFQCF